MIPAVPLTVADLLEQLMNKPLDSPVILRVNDRWKALTRVVVDEVAYSAWPAHPIQIRRVEVTLS